MSKENNWEEELAPFGRIMFRFLLSVSPMAKEEEVKEFREIVSAQIQLAKKEERERIIEKIKDSKTDIPKKPKSLKNGWERLAKDEKWLNECLKYSGRFNYNKALEDLIALISKDNE